MSTTGYQTKWQPPQSCFCDFQTSSFAKLNHKLTEKLLWVCFIFHFNFLSIFLVHDASVLWAPFNIQFVRFRWWTAWPNEFGCDLTFAAVFCSTKGDRAMNKKLDLMKSSLWDWYLKKIVLLISFCWCLCFIWWYILITVTSLLPYLSFFSFS